MSNEFWLLLSCPFLIWDVTNVSEFSAQKPRKLGAWASQLCSLIVVCPVTAPSAAAPGLKEVVSLLSCSTGHSSVNLTKEFNGPGLFTLSVASGKW